MIDFKGTSKEDLRAITDEELLEMYQKAASNHGIGTETGNSQLANKAAKLVAEIYRELKKRGPQKTSKVLALLGSSDPGVRNWAGAHALEIAPDRGEPVLEALSKGSGLVAFSAAMTLKVWRSGKLNFS